MGLIGGFFEDSEEVFYSGVEGIGTGKFRNHNSLRSRAAFGQLK